MMHVTSPIPPDVLKVIKAASEDGRDDVVRVELTSLLPLHNAGEDYGGCDHPTYPEVRSDFPAVEETYINVDDEGCFVINLPHLKRMEMASIYHRDASIK